MCTAVSTVEDQLLGEPDKIKHRPFWVKNKVILYRICKSGASPDPMPGLPIENPVKRLQSPFFLLGVILKCIEIPVHFSISPFDLCSTDYYVIISRTKEKPNIPAGTFFPAPG